ncbi:response regulator [soil metagenome]
MTDRPISMPVVLVVDDEALLRLNATEALHDAGCRTYEACEAREAMDMIADHPDISVLFTDINMPGDQDGLALAGHVHAARPDIQLIITSGRERPAPTDIPDDGQFIAKPYDMEVISEIVRTHRRAVSADDDR